MSHSPLCPCLKCNPSTEEWEKKIAAHLGPLPETPPTRWASEEQRARYILDLVSLGTHEWARLLGDPDSQFCLIAAGDPQLITEVCLARR